MSRTIIRLKSALTNQDLADANAKPHLSFELEEPQYLLGAHQSQPLLGDPNAGPFLDLVQGNLVGGSVEKAGRRLMEMLSENPAVSNALQMALNSGHARHPIYLQIDSDSADSFPWEALCSKDGMFLGLQPTWQIGRIANISPPQAESARSFQPPLRILAVLAAANNPAQPGTVISAQDEWNALYAALRGAGFPIEVRVFVCETGLRDTIEALQPDPNLTLNVSILGGYEDLTQAAGEVTPQIVHFFCHGSTQDGPHLQIATRVDWENGASGSINLEPGDLGNMPGLVHGAWLVTLNCCEGAAVPQGARSFARLLMANGFPAVVGMREAVATDDASVFCRAFYPALFAEIARWLENNAEEIVLDWASVLHAPRDLLCRRYSAGKPPSTAAPEVKQWTLPIVYVSREPFRLRRQAESNRETTLNVVTLFRDQFSARPDAASPEVAGIIADLNAKILALDAALAAP